MKDLTIQNITAAVKGVYHGPENESGREITAVVTDSRKVIPGCLFVPIVGARADGHDFIDQVMEAGAAVTLSEKDLPGNRFPWIRVESSLAAVRDLAAFYLSRLNIPVVGITGSVGKTSTKEAIASVLAQKYRVLKTLGNFNNELGLPLTIFRLTEEDEIAVLEMGISSFGEMSRLAAIARPDTAVITNIGTCHLEFLGDRDGVLRAKTEMLDYVRDNGHIVLNGDDDKLCTVSESHGIRPVFYRVYEKKADPPSCPGQKVCYAEQLTDLGLKGTRAVFHLEEDVMEVTVPVPGHHMVANALAAAVIGRIYGLSPEEIRRGIEQMETIDGRFHVIRVGDQTLIDDCYNANPMSMKASLSVLAGLGGRRVAVLGDMGELGKDEKVLHREVGKAAAAAGIDVLVCIGNLAREIAAGAREESGGTGMAIIEEDTVESFLAGKDRCLQPSDTILVKASHFMKFERIVEALQNGSVQKTE